MDNRRSVISKLAALVGISLNCGSVSANSASAIPVAPHPRSHPSGEDSAERLEVSLAGVSAAALGAISDGHIANRGDWAWHPAYQDTLELRRKFDTALRMLSDRIPDGQQIMLYPCGCSALGNLPDGEFLPLMDCGNLHCEDGGAASIVMAPKRPKPTIADLEAILAQDHNGPAAIVLPNGQVTA